MSTVIKPTAKHSSNLVASVQMCTYSWHFNWRITSCMGLLSTPTKVLRREDSYWLISLETKYKFNCYKNSKYIFREELIVFDQLVQKHWSGLKPCVKAKVLMLILKNWEILKMILKRLLSAFTV